MSIFQQFPRSFARYLSHLAFRFLLPGWLTENSSPDCHMADNDNKMSRILVFEFFLELITTVSNFPEPLAGARQSCAGASACG
jgi:hypothetical protein